MTDKKQQEKRTAQAAPSPLLLRGEIIFDKNNNGIKSFSGASVYIRLENVTMQDAPSKLILQKVIKGVSYDSDDISNHHHQKVLEFELLGDIVVDVQKS
jgi:hypothetical protein